MEQLSARLLLTAGILLLIAGGFSPFSIDNPVGIRYNTSRIQRGRGPVPVMALQREPLDGEKRGAGPGEYIPEQPSETKMK